jgi:PHP domain
MEGLFHVHSNYSADGRLSLEELREECRKRKYDFMVVTDHAEDFDSERIKRYLAHCRRLTDRDFIVVPGLEFRLDGEREVHVLVIGSEAFVSEKGQEDILKKVAAGESSALVVLAHPSRNGHYIPPYFESRINGVEIWNAAYDSRYLPDYRAVRLFHDLKKRNKCLLGFGGLDLHDGSGFRDLKLRMTHPCATEPELLAHLKAGRFTISGPHTTINSIPDWGFAKMVLLNIGRKLLAAGDFVKWQLVSPQNSG